MTELEKYWLNMCRRRKEDYVIRVDNDCVYVDNLHTGDCELEFQHFGWEMVIDLLRYIGCNAEEA